jgi:hypothetical protein
VEVRDAVCIDCSVVIDKRRAVKQLVKPPSQRRCRDCSETKEKTRQEEARQRREEEQRKVMRYKCQTCGVETHFYAILEDHFQESDLKCVRATADTCKILGSTSSRRERAAAAAVRGGGGGGGGDGGGDDGGGDDAVAADAAATIDDDSAIITHNGLASRVKGAAGDKATAATTTSTNSAAGDKATAATTTSTNSAAGDKATAATTTSTKSAAAAVGRHAPNWPCSSCGASVFATRDACYKCKTPRPEAGARTAGAEAGAHPARVEAGAHPNRVGVASARSLFSCPVCKHEVRVWPAMIHHFQNSACPKAKKEECRVH